MSKRKIRYVRLIIHTIDYQFYMIERKFYFTKIAQVEIEVETEQKSISGSESVNFEVKPCSTGIEAKVTEIVVMISIVSKSLTETLIIIVIATRITETGNVISSDKSKRRLVVITAIADKSNFVIT